VQQRGGGDHQHASGLGVVDGWVEQQAEVAVRHPAGLQDLAVRVCAELRHRPRSCYWWMGGHQATRPDQDVDLKRSTGLPEVLAIAGRRLWFPARVAAEPVATRLRRWRFLVGQAPYWTVARC
jgi:hypothetical protein